MLIHDIKEIYPLVNLDVVNLGFIDDVTYHVKNSLSCVEPTEDHK